MEFVLASRSVVIVVDLFNPDQGDDEQGIIGSPNQLVADGLQVVLGVLDLQIHRGSQRKYNEMLHVLHFLNIN